MEPIKFVQTWDPVAGRKQEYATFMTEEFWPHMRVLDVEVVSGWYTLIGGGPRVEVESPAESLDQVESALRDEGLQEMLRRFMNLVTGYSSSVLEPAGWAVRGRGEAPSQGEVKFVQAWDVLPGEQGACERFMGEVHLPEMEAIGLAVNSGWHLLVGSGPQVHSEALAQDLVTVSKALNDKRYLRLITRMEELVTNYESRILVPHRSFLEMVNSIHGRAIRAVASDEMHPMVGPVVDWVRRK